MNISWGSVIVSMTAILLTVSVMLAFILFVGWRIEQENKRTEADLIDRNRKEKKNKRQRAYRARMKKEKEQKLVSAKTVVNKPSKKR